MISSYQQKLFDLWRYNLNPEAPPQTRDEALCRINRILARVLKEFRVLFYLKPVPSGTNPRDLLPCPTRLLAPGAFVYEGSDNSYFMFESEDFCYLPLTLNSHNFGYLFLEISISSFDLTTQMVLALLAVQVAQYLKDFDPEIPSPCRSNFLGTLKIEPRYRQIWIGEEPIYVSDNEFVFLALLSQFYAQGKPCLRELLCQVIYLEDAVLTRRRETRLDSLVFRLKQKLKLKAGQQIRIETIRGVGYQLRLSPSL